MYARLGMGCDVLECTTWYFVSQKRNNEELLAFGLFGFFSSLDNRVYP
jgi:hypothetical protein